MSGAPPPVRSRLHVSEPRVMRFPCRLIVNCDAALRTPYVRIIRDPREWYLFDYSIGLINDTLLGITIRVLNFEDRPRITPPSFSLLNRTRLLIRITNNFNSDTALLRVELLDSLCVTTLRPAPFVKTEKLQRIPSGVALIQLKGQDDVAVDRMARELRNVAQLTSLPEGFYRYVPYEIARTSVRKLVLNRTALGYLLAVRLREDDSVSCQRVVSAASGRLIAWSREKQ